MLPNWLLGKSKSKLQEILGGGGGGTDYTAGDGIDISNGVISFDPATAPAIDPSKVDGLDDDLAALAPKTALANANILHNPWFTVNQRNESTITVNGRYIADRWRTYIPDNDNGSFIRNSDGTITIDATNSSNGIMIVQRRTTNNLQSLNGFKVTASVKLSDDSILSGTDTFDITASVVYIDNEDFSLISNAHQNGQMLSLLVKSGKTLTIKALKLEIGEISTLAMDYRPEYAIELAKCKRYFQRLSIPSTGLLAIGFAQWAQGIRFTLPFDPMRGTNPTITVTSQATKIGYSSSNAAAATAINGVSIAYNEGNQIWFQATVTSATVGDTYVLLNMDTADMYFDLSAEL